MLATITIGGASKMHLQLTFGMIMDGLGIYSAVSIFCSPKHSLEMGTDEIPFLNRVMSLNDADFVFVIYVVIGFCGLYDILKAYGNCYYKECICFR